MVNNLMSERCQKLARWAKAVIDRPSRIRMLPVQEHLAVALILNRADLLRDGEFTILQAVNTLDAEWLSAATQVERSFMSELDD